MDRSGKNATDDDYAFMRTEAFDALDRALDATRPWAVRAATEKALDSWIGLYRPNLAGHGWHVEIAGHLQRLGSGRNTPDHVAMTAITLHMIANAAARGDVADLGDGLDLIVNPRRTRRDDRARQVDPAAYRLARIQQDLDIAALVRGGRQPQAARRWLRSNPGKHAVDAPPQRKPNASS